MKESSILNGWAQISQSEQAAYALDSQIPQLKAIQTTFNNIASNAELQGASAKAIKGQMSDYSEIIGACISANEGDIGNFATAVSVLQPKYYSGAEILGAQKEALQQKTSDEAERDRCYKEYWDRSEIFSSSYYYYRYLHFKKAAEDDQDDYDYWCSVEKEFDNIEASTNGLFASTGVRTAINSALNDMPSNFAGGNYDVSKNNDAKLRIQNAFKNSFLNDVTKSEVDPYKIADRIRRSADLQSIEYRALVETLNGMGITVSDTTPPSKLAETVKSKFDADIAINRNADGTYNVNPFDSLKTDVNRILYVSAYETLYPDDALKMDNIDWQFAVEGYEGWQEDLNNVKFLVYTSEDPFKGLFMQEASSIIINDFNCKETSYFSPNPFDYGVHIDYTDMDQDKYGAGAYTTFFHECGHEIDYQKGGIFGYYSIDYRDENGNALTDILVEDVKSKISDAFYNNWDPADSGCDQAYLLEQVRDYIMNEVDYLTYGEPTILDPTTKKYYTIVRDSIIKDIGSYSNPVSGSNYPSDVFGGLSGNTLLAGFGHPATTNVFHGGSDEKGRLYWVEGKINKDGTGLRVKMADGSKSDKESMSVIDDYAPNNAGNIANSNFDEKIILMDSDVAYTDAPVKESFAEYFSANITNDPNELKQFDFYGKDTQDFLYDMSSGMNAAK